MDIVQHIVTLDPSAVELVDHTLIALSRNLEIYRPTVERFVRGQPEALLLVEFAGEDLQVCQQPVSHISRDDGGLLDSPIVSWRPPILSTKKRFGRYARPA